MPHICLEYSVNLETAVNMAVLCDELRRAAIKTGVFPLAGVRVRALPCTHYSIADGAAHHGFIDISVRLRAGRTLDVRKDATAAIFAAAETFLAPVMAARPLALSMEMRDIDPDLSPKSGTIRQYLEGGG
ncbi:MAG: 5-carboxymethyl-2-hydroxymuconate Delta-isomerase [Rhodobacteraceae bacterium]|nr:5-carboxymethyl-2-hydroxymuconate Delta-isomerase [Paracoccaceae bacterium]